MRRHVFSGVLPARADRNAHRLAEALLAIQGPLPETEARFRPPRPGRAALATACPLLVLICAAGVLSWQASALAASALLALALGRAAFTLHDRSQSRSLADRLLRSHPRSPLSPLAAWRAEELTSEPTRKQLRRRTRTLRRESERCLDPGPSLFKAAPAAGINEAAVRESILLLRGLEARLGDVAEPVSAAGVLAVSALVVGDSWSPLYFPERSVGFPDALADALDALTVR
jgi:hypothetical protein